MTFKKIAVAALLAASAVSSFAAFTSVGGGLTGSDQTVDSFVASGSFTSAINFVGSTGYSAWLTNGTTTYNYVPGGVFFVGSTAINTFSLGGSLANDTWEIHVAGTGGSFNAATTYNVGTLPSAPVPEPETYAMLLAGLGALGFMGRRRKAKQG
ncbi:MAG: PEP-CTERM sorting domain-containing protein [Burkholderiales bacterium]|nr:PEP-CTERM sorting domain-containing protein [Burkholderiales bacterium]